MGRNVRDSIDYSSLINELKDSIPKQMEENKIPGLSIALIDGNNLVWTEGFGYTDLTKDHKVTPDTLFSLQSISKTYTATGFLIAVSKGLVELDDPLRKYYPEFTVNSRFGESEADKITFRHLLSHRSGLTHEAPVGNNFSDKECTFEEHIKSISDTWLKYPVGERCSYSNLGIDLVGYGLQLISGKPFPEYMKEELFDPLGMTNSTYNQRYVKENRVFAKGHTDDDETPQDLIPMIPSGSLFSSARDMAKFVLFHLSGGIVNGKRLIDETILEEMYKPQFPVKNQLNERFALGIGRYRMFDTVLLSHSGGGYGYLTDQRWLPEYNIGVVVLTNQHYHNVHGTIANDALGKMIKLKYGMIPEGKPFKTVEFTDKPVISLKTDKLYRLEGDYWVDAGLMLVRVMDGELYRTLPGGEPGKLTPHSETEFTNPKGELFIFKLDERGKPEGILILKHIYGPYYRPLHSSPHDLGPDKREWRKLTGIYSAQIHGNIDYFCVTMKNGYLYMQREGSFREYKPNFFFTSEGEAVIFGDNSMNYRNIPLTKETDPYVKLLRLAETDSDNRRLRERSMRGLGNAYLTMGDLDKAIEVFVLNVKLHPRSISALHSLAETYNKKDDKMNSERYYKKILAIDPKNEKALKKLDEITEK